MDLAGRYLCEAVFHTDFKSVSLFDLWPCISTHKAFKDYGISKQIWLFLWGVIRTYQFIWRPKLSDFSVVWLPILLEKWPDVDSKISIFKQPLAKVTHLQRSSNIMLKFAITKECFENRRVFVMISVTRQVGLLWFRRRGGSNLGRSRIAFLDI